MNTLITGGAGYLGTVTALELARAGHTVVCLDPKGPPPGLEFFAGSDTRKAIQWIPNRILDPSVLKTLAAKADAVVHLAFVVGGPACLANPALAERLAVSGTTAVVKAAIRNNSILLFASSDAVYGNKATGVCGEDFACEPVDLYGELKLRCEHIVNRHARPLIVRLPSHFGVSPAMRADLLVHTMGCELFHNKEIRLFEADITRTLIHVRDAAAAIRLLLESAAASGGNPAVGVHTFNVAGGAWTKREIADTLAREIGGRVILGETTGADPNKRNFTLDCRKIRDLGFQPKWDLQRAAGDLRSYLMATNI